MKYRLLILVVILFTSCITDDSITPEIDFTAVNEEEILDYIADNNLTAVKSDSGLYYVVDELGTGEQPIATSNVTVAYKGYFTNGSVFDQSNTEGIAFDLQRLIIGFAEGITYFKEGGKGILLLPSRLAYGNGSATIPAGAVLIFDITVISVN